jgi:integral membrane sensor domain MASE1
MPRSVARQTSVLAGIGIQGGRSLAVALMLLGAFCGYVGCGLWDLSLIQKGAPGFPLWPPLALGMLALVSLGGGAVVHMRPRGRTSM